MMPTGISLTVAAPPFEAFDLLGVVLVVDDIPEHFDVVHINVLIHLSIHVVVDFMHPEKLRVVLLIRRPLGVQPGHHLIPREVRGSQHGYGVRPPGGLRLTLVSLLLPFRSGPLLSTSVTNSSLASNTAHDV